MPSAVISARPAPFPPRRSLPRPAPSAWPFPKKKTRFTFWPSLFDDDLRKIRETREFFLNGSQQSKAILPQIFLRTVDQDFDEEPIKRRRDRRHRFHCLAVAPGAGELLDRLPRLK